MTNNQRIAPLKSNVSSLMSYLQREPHRHTASDVGGRITLGSFGRVLVVVEEKTKRKLVVQLVRDGRGDGHPAAAPVWLHEAGDQFPDVRHVVPQGNV